MIWLWSIQVEQDSEQRFLYSVFEDPDEQHDKMSYGLGYSIAMLSICSIILILYIAIWSFKLIRNSKYIINLYWYLAILGLLMLRISAVSYLTYKNCLFVWLEDSCVSLFLLSNVVMLVIWVRRTVMLRFESESDYYSRVKTLSHIIIAFVFIFLLILQAIGLIFKVINYIHLSLEIVVIVSSLIITYKTVKSVRIFETREVNRSIAWICIISG